MKAKPLTLDELAEWREWLDDRSVNWPRSAGNAVARLVATVDAERARGDQAETERDAAHAVIRRLLDGWTPIEEPVGEQTFHRWYDGYAMDDIDGPGTEPMTPAEAAAIRAATGDQP